MRATRQATDDGDHDSLAALAMRYALLFSVGFAGLFIMLLSLTAAAQIIAAGAGFDRSGIISAGGWGLALVIAISALPLVRFSVADAPGLVMGLTRRYRRRAVFLVLIAVCAWVFAWI